MFWYHLISMEIKISKTSPVFVENMSMVLNKMTTGSNLNNKTVALSYHFVRDHVSNNVVEVKKIKTRKCFADLFTKPLEINDFHMFYHKCTVNG